MDEMLALGAVDVYAIINFVDTTCIVHDDCKIHTRGAETIGHGVLASMFNKKINTKRST